MANDCPTSVSSPIDFDRADTWPVGLRRVAQEWADKLTAGTVTRNDLFYDDAAEIAFRALLDRRPVLAYHCTRLLDHEAIAIREGGLTLRTRDSLNARIHAAYDHCPEVDGADRDRLLRLALLISRRRPEPNHVGPVCLVGSRRLFDERPCVGADQLSHWGGEAIYGMDEASDLPPHLLTLGKPSIVVAALDLMTGIAERKGGPSLVVAFSERLRNDTEPFSVASNVPVAATEVIAIWQPKSAEYDDHVELPKR